MRRHVRRKTSAFLRPESFRHLNERCMTHDLTVVQSSAERFQVTRKLRSGKALGAQRFLHRTLRLANHTDLISARAQGLAKSRTQRLALRSRQPLDRRPKQQRGVVSRRRSSGLQPAARQKSDQHQVDRKGDRERCHQPLTVACHGPAPAPHRQSSIGRATAQAQSYRHPGG